MAHFAEIDENNIVLRVVVIPDEEENRGQEYLAEDLGLGGTWLKASYNTMAGVHANGGTPFRKNFPSTGDSYNPDLDAFVPKTNYASWTEIDPQTGTYLPPVPMPTREPTDEFVYEWDEEQVNWKKVYYYNLVQNGEL